MNPVREGSRDGSEPRTCVLCAQPVGDPRARYCSRACQQRAYRLRQAPTAPDLGALRADLRRRRDLGAHTIYECSRCETRRLGEQRCPDCQIFGQALGLGGLCPECDTPLLLTELLGLDP